MTDEKLYMAPQSRRKWQLGFLVAFLLSLPTCLFSESINPVKVMFTYEHLLDVAEEKIITETPNKAFSFLAKAKEIRPEPEFRFYNLTGDAHWKLGNNYEAMEAFSKSLIQNNSQHKLFLRVADFYEQERKPKLALEFNEQYIALVPEDKSRIFKLAILSRRLGNEEAYQKYIAILESDKAFSTEEEALLTSLTRSIKSRKWKEAEELALRYLFYFPRSEGMYETLILARRGNKSSKIEDAYVNACTTFKDDTRYFVRYGVYLQENGRYLESLSAFRRALFNALKHEVKSDWGEFLFLLRQSYANLGWEKETRAMDSLVKDIKNREKLTDESLEDHMHSFRKNREYLLFGIYWFREKNPIKADHYRRLLSERDQENAEIELFFVVGPFAFEKLSF